MKKVAVRLTSSKISSKSKIKIDFIVITVRLYNLRDETPLGCISKRMGRAGSSLSPDFPLGSYEITRT
jgi:hypothetical protein